MTIIPAQAVQNDPQHLLYHNPSIHPVKYTKLSREYNYWKSVDAAEQTAQALGCLLVPASCLHWSRKTKKADRRIQIGRHSFFAIRRDELTEVEYQKYLDEVNRVQKAAQ